MNPRGLITRAMSMLLVSLACAAVNANAPDEAIARNVDQYVSARANLGQFNGVLLIARGDRAIYRKAFGFADVEKQTPYQPEFTQPVASISKMFTAFVALSLQAEGLLNLQDPVCKYFSPCPATWRPMALMHLVRHTSGIPDYEERLVIGSDRYHHYMQRPGAADQILADAMNEKPEFAPGTKFKYSNSGYVVLAHVLQRAAKRPLAELVYQYALKPAGMTASGVLREGERPSTLVPGYTHPELDWGKKLAGYPVTSGHLKPVPALPLTGAAGDAGVYSNVDDLLRWSVVLQDAKFISADMRKEMFDAGMGGYGFGWFVGKAFDQTRHRHTGNLPGYLADFVRFPDERITLIVLSNHDRSSVTRMVRDVSAIILGKPFDMPVEGKVASLTSTQVEALIGEYSMQDGTKVSIAGSPAELKATWKGRFTSILIPLSPTECYLALADGRATFALDATGKARSVNLRYSGEDNLAIRLN